jgi:hypothetical protein
MESVVRITTRWLLVLVFVASVAVIGDHCSARSIEAVKGKHYRLSKRNGPWMIMVASFNAPPEDRRTDGLTPAEAADQLVYELRCKGIPAYVYRQDDVEGKVTTVNRRTQQAREGKVLAWHGGICVLAGNYPTSNDKIAQATLKYIKDPEKFKPPFLSEITAEGKDGPGELVRRTKTGGIFWVTKQRPGPLSGAFMTTNPLLSDEDLAVRTRDPLLLRLNSGVEYSLLQNKGKYTVIVATFQGKGQLEYAGEKKMLKVSTALDDAAESAWELCTALRHAKVLGYDEEFEAYVYHDRHSSIVTVGSFDDPRDPRITELQNKFGAKVAGLKPDGTPASLTAEAFSAPRQPQEHEAAKRWIFDPFPQVIEVPR